MPTPAQIENAKWPADAVVRWSIDRLIPNARNARTHSPEQVDQIARSMKEWGWTNPILVGEDGGIIAGHGRVLAARQLGIAEVPVMIAEGWSEEQKRAYIIADNKLALNAGWDDEMLRVELSDLGALGFDLALVGFSADELSAMSLGVRESDFPDLPIGEQGDMRTMTFTVHKDQLDRIMGALKAAREQGPFDQDETENKNRNGNALARVCDGYLNAVGEGHQGSTH
jgi:hypothetical protein